MPHSGAVAAADPRPVGGDCPKGLVRSAHSSQSLRRAVSQFDAEMALHRRLAM